MTAKGLQQEEDIVWASVKALESIAMSAHHILGLEQVPRVWLFAN